jgi:gliding motility-associated-like protein
MKINNFVIIVIGIFAIFLLHTYPVFAQFTLDKTSGCAPLVVTATNTSGIPSVLYDFGQGNGLKPEATSQAYTKAGTYTIQQLVGGFMGTKTQTITVFANETPNFSIDFCSNNTITVKILSNAMPTYLIEYGDATQDIVNGLTSTSHQYTDNAPKTVTVSGFIKDVGTCGTASQTITPLAKPIAAVFSQVKVLPNNEIELSFQQNAANSYQIEEFNETTNLKKNYAIASNATNFKLTSRNLDTDSYIYRVNALDKCQNIGIQSAEAIGTINLQATAQGQQNTLTWDMPLYFGFVRYEIYRDNVLLETITSRNTQIYADKKITCNRVYNYRLELVLHGGKSRSISLSRSVTAVAASSPKMPQNPNVSVTNSSLELTWKYAVGDSAKMVIINKSIDGIAEKEIILPANTQKYIDSNVRPTDKSYCYTISYIDLCGNKSPKSNTVCNTLLKGTEDDKNVILTWQGVIPPNSKIFLEKFSEKDTSSIAITGGSYNDLKSAFKSPEVHYRLRIVTTEGVSYSNIFSVLLETEFEIPNAFSPNGDGLNDVFRPTSTRFLSSYKMTIFSQWGTVIFETTDSNKGWNGETESGVLAPTGVYAFQINYFSSIGRPTVKQGIVTLIK